MLRRKLLYLFILLGCIWLVMLYVFRELRFLLCLLIVVPVICLGILIFQATLTKVELPDKEIVVTRGEECVIPIRIIHKGFLPLGRFCCKYCRILGDRTERDRMVLRGISDKVKQVQLTWRGEHCGVGQLRITKLKLYDWFGLFSMGIRGKASVRVLIYPKCESVSQSEAQRLSGIFQSRGSDKDGDYYIREYRPGDNQKSIHWKLTVKSEEVMVRDFEVSNRWSLFLHCADSFLTDADKKDLFLERAAAIINLFMVDRENLPEVFWLEEGLVQSFQLKEPEDFSVCLLKLITMQNVGVENPHDERIRGLLQGFHLEEDGFYLGENCIYEYQTETE